MTIVEDLQLIKFPAKNKLLNNNSCSIISFLGQYPHLHSVLTETEETTREPRKNFRFLYARAYTLLIIITVRKSSIITRLKYNTEFEKFLSRKSS